MNSDGRPVVTRVSGPVVTVAGMPGAGMYEVVRVGELGLVGEVVRQAGGLATVQVYEDTSMLKPGAPVARTGAPLSLLLGPGLIGNIYDGIQRPLPALLAAGGAWLRRGARAEPLAAARKWAYKPLAAAGDEVSPGQTLGEVLETPLVKHRIMVPPGVSGRLLSAAPAGEYEVSGVVAVVGASAGPAEVRLAQTWPARTPRPARERLRVTRPLVTGQRVIDTFFPLGKGGAASIPGGFGTGKTIMQHQLAKWSDAGIIIFIGCGERGNEMTEVLREFPRLKDPRTGRPLMERTILIANTSNMPVAAREVSIYTGITMAEYYRDMGYDVAVFADSTSRWAEALRELAARLEEMPAEEGFQASLPSRLAQFYERGGAVTTLGGEKGSVSIVGAVSPPGGDFSEPVTQHTRRFTRVFWSLDTELANARHYPSINWLRSYSDYADEVSAGWEKEAPDWKELRAEALELLQREEHYRQIARLVGPDSLPDGQRLYLFVGGLLRDGFLAQSAFDEADAYCEPVKQAGLLRLIVSFYRRAAGLIKAGTPLASVAALPCTAEILRAKTDYANGDAAGLARLGEKVTAQFDGLAGRAPGEGA
jgi:V/A-type H+-transporting ATPase subunit A